MTYENRGKYTDIKYTLVVRMKIIYSKEEKKV